MAPSRHDTPRSRNRLLAALPQADFDVLRPHLVPVQVVVRQVLYEAGGPIEHAYFPERSLASVVATSDEGGAIEVGIIGRDGLVGLPLVLGADWAPHQIFVQVANSAQRIEAARLTDAVEQSPALRRRLLRYAQGVMSQGAQIALCNRLHVVEERLARWLLMSQDRVGEDQLPLTQEFLSLMLGVRRAGVNLAIGALANAGLIRHTRGSVTILDRPGLEAASCDCYAFIEAEFDRLLGRAARHLAGPQRHGRG